MAEIRRGGVQDGPERRPAFGDRLPWLEPVEDEDVDLYHQQAGGYRGVVLVGVAILALIAIVTAVVLWVRHDRATADIGQIIRAEPGPYKVRPQDPGGMKPDMTERVAAATNAGRDIDAPLDMAALPEQSIVTRRPQQPAPVQGAAPQGAATVPPAPVAAPTPAPSAPPPPMAAGGQIQLGAFSSEAKAKAAWKGLSSRFDFLKDMTPIIGATEANGAKLFRLRATGSPEPASKLCGRLRLAGESCAVTGG